MMKLSKRGWNNVLIFAVLILMFFLYDIPGQLQKQEPPLYSFVAENTELLSVEFDHFRLVKTAGQWQFQPAITVSSDAAQLAMAWQHTKLQPFEPEQQISLTPVSQAVVLSAGQHEPVQWLLFSYQQSFMVQQVGQPLFFLISSQQAQLLFPSLP